MKKLFCVRNRITGGALAKDKHDDRMLAEAKNSEHILWFERKIEAKRLRDQQNEGKEKGFYVVSLGPDHRRYRSL